MNSDQIFKLIEGALVGLLLWTIFGGWAAMARHK